MNVVNSDLGVGLLGMGVVGTAVAATLIGRAEEFAKHTGKNLKLHNIIDYYYQIYKLVLEYLN